jgi:hypothetical protein
MGITRFTVAAVVLMGVLTACSSGGSSGSDPGSNSVAEPAQGNIGNPNAGDSPSAAPSGPSFAVSCKMVNGSGGSWEPQVTVKNTGSAPMQLPDLNVVNTSLMFDFEWFGSNGAQVGTASDGAAPDQAGQITTIQPGSSSVFTFDSDGMVNQAQDTLKVSTCTAIIQGYSDAY